jgi:hypothetical protein
LDIIYQPEAGDAPNGCIEHAKHAASEE